MHVFFKLPRPVDVPLEGDEPFLPPNMYASVFRFVNLLINQFQLPFSCGTPGGRLLPGATQRSVELLASSEVIDRSLSQPTSVPYGCGVRPLYGQDMRRMVPLRILSEGFVQ